jgi:hypothetical protein
MEQSDFMPEELLDPEVHEREPQPDDAAVAFRQIVSELAPDVDPEDVETVIGEIGDAVDLEDVLGVAAGGFAQLGMDYDQGLEMLRQILQIEAILPGGDQPEI